MNELEEYLGWVASRLDQDDPPREEPDLELKSIYNAGAAESEAVWELADLLASLANDTRIDGYRCLVYGPANSLTRPPWLPDEARLRDKLLRHFEGGVVPGVELVRREISERGIFDAFVIVERESTPYVTRLHSGGEWGVRVRTNTARRTATRAELIALAKGRRLTQGPVRRLDARITPLGKGTKKIDVTNVGTVSVRDIGFQPPPEGETRPLTRGEASIDLLHPGERDVIPILAPRSGLGSSPKSERLTVEGTAEDGEPVATTVLISSFD